MFMFCWSLCVFMLRSCDEKIELKVSGLFYLVKYLGQIRNSWYVFYTLNPKSHPMNILSAKPLEMILFDFR